jgi:hypothetical protein
VNKQTYIDILLHLRDGVRRKQPEKVETTFSFPSLKCSSKRVGFGQGFLSIKQLFLYRSILHNPDLAPAKFYMVPQLKSAFKKRSFCDVTDIIENAKEELKRSSKSGYQKCY